MTDTDSFVTDFAWFSSLRGGGAAAPREEFFAVACSDGFVLLAAVVPDLVCGVFCYSTFRLIGKTGRQEKSIEAHAGAVTSIKWAWDGSALATVRCFCLLRLQLGEFPSCAAGW